MISQSVLAVQKKPEKNSREADPAQSVFWIGNKTRYSAGMWQ